MPAMAAVRGVVSRRSVKGSAAPPMGCTQPYSMMLRSSGCKAEERNIAGSAYLCWNAW